MLTSVNNCDSTIQFNKLQSIGHIPEWVCCQLEGNDMLEATIFIVEAESISCGDDYQLDWEVSPSAENSLVVKGGLKIKIALYPVSGIRYPVSCVLLKFDVLQDSYVRPCS